MKVVLNSDVLYTTYPLQELPRRIRQLCQACSSRGVPIVLPETTLLEFNRAQDDHVDREREELQDAVELLESYGVEHEEVAPDSLISRADLVQLMEDTGVDVEVIPPTPSEYEEAHRRTCLHEPPHPPDTDSSEMRDVLIWCVALRVARAEGRAILLSRDRVHVKEPGGVEAEDANLLRLDEVGKVMEALHVESPTGKMARSLLAPVWDELVESGLPAGRPFDLQGIDAPAFVRGDEGLKHAEADIRTSGPGEGQQMAGHLTLELHRGAIEEVRIEEVTVDGEEQPDVVIEFDEPRPIETESPDYTERLAALDEILGGGSSWTSS